MKLEIKNQRIAITEREALVSGTVNVYTAEFSFDDTWAEYTPVAVFESGNVSREAVITDGKCTIPWETLLPNGYLRIGVYGVNGDKRLPTIYTDRQFVARGAENAEGAAEPSPGVVEQVVAQMAADRAAAENAANRAEAAAIHQPYPNTETGTWWVWDADTGAYQNTGVAFSGDGAVGLDKTLTTEGVAADAKAVGDALAGKQDKPDIRAVLDDVAVAGAQYYLGEQTEVSIVLPDDAEVGQIVLVSWYNGETAATLSITGTMLEFDFAPSANTRSEINALWDGTCWAVLGNEMEVVTA